MSSDDVPIDLQIEESLSREVLMAIDSTNRRDDCWTSWLFVSVLLVCFCIGLLGPPVAQQKENLKKWEDSTTKFIFALDDITPQNHFVDCDVFFVRQTAEIANTTVINLVFQVLKYKNENPIEMRRIPHDDVSLEFLVNSLSSKKVHVFADRLLYYDKVAVKVPNIGCGVLLTWTYGNPNQVSLQVGFRSLFALACVIALTLLLTRMKPTPFKIWHLEQKLTVFLLFFAILADDPLYFLQFLEVTRIGIIYDVVTASLFKVYLLFFMLTLFDSLRFKNRKIEKCFFTPKYFLFAIMIWADILHRLYDHSQTYAFAQLASPWTRWLISSVQWALQLVAVAWLLIAVWKASFMIDVTENYKFTAYATTSISSFLVVTIFELLSQLKLLRHTSLSFVMVFSVQNCFVLIMTIFHWPFELLTDREYQDTGFDTPEFLLVSDST